MLRKTLAPTLALAMLAGTASAQTEITWWHAMGGQLGETVNEIATGFNASQDQYRITPVYKGGYEDTLTATIAAFRAGEQPNIVQVFDAGAATIIGAEGAVIPAADLMKDNGIDFNPDDYIDGVRYFYANADGKMVGMPFNSSTPILYYNVEALDAAGVTPPATWEEFEQIAPAIAEAGYVPLAQSHLPWIFTENFMSRHNIPFATNANGFEGAEGTEILPQTDAIEMHFDKLAEWYAKDWFGYYGAAWNANQTPFENGEIAMWLGSSGSFGGLRNSVDFPFSATYLPYWEQVTDNPTNTFIGGAALFAMSGHPAEENKATAEFFEYLSSPEVQLMWHQATGYVPITKAAYQKAQDEDYYEEVPQAEVGIQQLSLPGGEWSRGYRMGFYVQIRDIMNREYAQVIQGDKSAAEAFEVIRAEGNKLLDRFAKTMN